MLPLVFLVLAFLRAAQCAVSGISLDKELRAVLSPKSVVSLASDAQFPSEFTPRFNVLRPPTYLVGTKPSTYKDIEKIVSIALKNHIPLLATGGGHGYSLALGGEQNGINVDLGLFNNIHIDHRAQTVKIGGSVRSRNLTEALQVAGFQNAAPNCPCVGYAGATLGGGIGPYSGLYGALSDSLVSLEMVTGAGKAVHVSSTSHPDLFYAMKGSGSSFGIVTSLKYKIYPATNGGEVFNTDMVFPSSLNGTVWKLIKDVAQSQPKELTVGLSLGYSNNAPTGPQGIIIGVNFQYAGPKDAAMPFIQPFLDIGPLNLQMATVPWKDIPTTASYGAIAKFGCTPGQHYVPYTVNLYDVDIASLIQVVNVMEDEMAKDPVLQMSTVVWQQYSKYGFQQHAQDSSAFQFRNVTAFVQVDGNGQSSSDEAVLSDFGVKIRDLLQKGSGKPNLEAFVHFSNGNEGADAWFPGADFGLLRKMKAIHDPSGLFNWYNPAVTG